jgi:hypothetical protein
MAVSEVAGRPVRLCGRETCETQAPSSPEPGLASTHINCRRGESTGGVAGLSPRIPECSLWPQTWALLCGTE